MITMLSSMSVCVMYIPSSTTPTRTFFPVLPLFHAFSMFIDGDTAPFCKFAKSENTYQ